MRILPLDGTIQTKSFGSIVDATKGLGCFLLLKLFDVLHTYPISWEYDMGGVQNEQNIALPNAQRWSRNNFFIAGWWLFAVTCLPLSVILLGICLFPLSFFTDNSTICLRKRSS